MNRYLIYIYSIILFCFFCTRNIYAQENNDTIRSSSNKVRLHGRILDENQDAVAFVLVRVLGQGIGTSADLDGKYKLEFNSGDSIVIQFSMFGYETREKVLKKPHGDLAMNIVMVNSDHSIGEVTIKDVRRQLGSTQNISTKDLQRMPSTTGNRVEELVATQAGVSTHNELSSQYNVRGGSFDENCVYINGVEIYRPMLISSGQQEGLSVINSDMVDNISFSAGGFEAKYGDKMSSVLDITYGHPKSWESTIQASLLGGSIYAGYGNKKFSFSNGLRYKTNQYMLGTLQTKGEYSPSFLDYQGYMAWSPTKKLTIDVIGYISNNRYRFIPKTRETKFGTMENIMSFKVDFDGQEEDVFRTLFGTAKASYQLNKNSKLSLSLSAFNTKERETYDIQGQYWLNETNDDEQLGVGTYMEHARKRLTSSTKTLKMDYDIKFGYHTLLTGISWKVENVNENSREWEYRDSSGYCMPRVDDELQVIYNLKSINNIRANAMEWYLQDTWRKESDLGTINLNYGARLSYWNWNKEWLFSPRVCLGYVPSSNDNFTFRLATGLYYQRPYYKELRDTVTTHGNTLVVLNRNIKSQRSFQILTGLEYKFTLADRPFKFTSELYYKAQGHINPYNVDNVKIVYYGENIASGYVIGADFKVYGEFVPGTDSWISFGLMKTQMNLNGKKIPQPTDQRYNINFFFSDYFPGTTRWKMNLKASFADGLPFAPPHTGLEKKHFKATDYKRVDIGMNYRALNNEDRHLRHNAIKNIWLGLDCFNVFGFNNVSGYYWVTDVTGQQFAVPNYLTGRQINGRVQIEF